ncbi:heme peroxidase [Rhizoclosmatium globosum]|uniref:Heme peroxidase n=1 Tax=Rhizoclosmatium globosum TaxID=329046 RepID=A0A1Y2BZB1_9FUNG|nr:heme peroxidase [Rhizoclosmatium globosum]|eukprot:ORY40123.1 heme peroxidase [Rhizoclosmatium globosum]
MGVLATTLWWTFSLLHGLVFLEQIRGSQLWTVVHDTSGSADLPPLDCSTKTKIRTVDGTCNDLNHPWSGSRFYRFGRASPLEDVKSDTFIGVGGLPNPRTLAHNLLARKNGETTYAPQQNLIAAAWIQFQTHDWFQHMNSPKSGDTINVPVLIGDPMWKAFGANVMSISKTLQDTTGSKKVPLAYQNNQTHWWDLSQVYGTDAALLDKLRSHKGGKLIMDSQDLIPLGPNGIEITGFSNNWWLGLSLMHNLFAKNHNMICDKLAKAYPTMTDEDLFQKARLINAAISAKIHTTEWTPALLANEHLYTGMNANWRGVEALQYPPLVGYQNPDPINVTYQFPEEFHPPKPIQQFRHKLNGCPHSQKLPNSINKPPLPTGETIDLSTIDLVRDRERGIPRYNAYRRLMNLPPKLLFSDISSDPQTAADLALLYAGDIEAVDLLVGSLAEDARPTGFAFSETTFRLFMSVASRRISADRLFTTDYTADAADMKSLLIGAFPELKGAGLEKVANPFLVWDDAGVQGKWVEMEMSVKKQLDLAVAQMG